MASRRLSDGEISLAIAAVQTRYDLQKAPFLDPYGQTVMQRLRDRQPLTAAQAQHVVRALRVFPATNPLEAASATTLIEIFEARQQAAREQVRRRRGY